MTREKLIFLGVAELIALAVIIHMWVKRRRGNVWGRLFWTVVLLVPLFGFLMYGFTGSSPDAHSDENSSSGFDG